MIPRPSITTRSFLRRKRRSNSSACTAYKMSLAAAGDISYEKQSAFPMKRKRALCDYALRTFGPLAVSSMM